MTTPTLTRWEDDAACRVGAGADPELWWPERERCAAAAEQDPPAHPVVVGGIRYVMSKETGRRGIVPARRGPAPHSHGCPYCRRGAR